MITGNKIHSGSGAGISIKEVADFIGCTSYSLGDVCTDSKVNRWSFRKPVRHSSKGNITDEEIKSVNCGIKTVRLSKMVGMTLGFVGHGNLTMEECIAEISEWTYDKPRGSASNEWFRLLDFDGYNSASLSIDNNWRGTNLESWVTDMKTGVTVSGSGYAFTVSPSVSHIYTLMAMRFSEDACFGCTVDSRDLYPSLIIGDSFTTDSWRLALAVWTPIGDTGYWALFPGAKTIGSTLSTVLNALPEMSSNPYGAYMISKSVAEGNYEFTCVPVLVKNLSYKTVTDSGSSYTCMYCEEGVTEIYAMPSGNTGIAITFGSPVVSHYKMEITYNSSAGTATCTVTNIDTVSHVFVVTVTRVNPSTGAIISQTDWSTGTLASGASASTISGHNQNVSSTFTMKSEDGNPIT